MWLYTRMSFFLCASAKVDKYTLFVCAADNFTDAAVSSKVNGEHKEKDLEPWDGGETRNSDSLESLDTDLVRKQMADTHSTYIVEFIQVFINAEQVLSSKPHPREFFSSVCCEAFLICLSLLNQSNGWDPNDMFKYNEEKYGVLSTYDSSLSTYT